MKYLLSCFLFLICIGVDAQCPPGDVHLKTQAEVHAFKRLYPLCDQIHGNLIIGDAVHNDVRDLSPLKSIKRVDNDLSILNCLTLESTNQLNSIIFIGQNISVQGLVRLKEISFLYNIDTVYGNLAIDKMPSLENLNFLSNINVVNGNLAILTSTGDFTTSFNLSKIRGEFRISNVNEVTTLHSFSKLQHVGQINITNCQSLLNIEGLQNIKPEVLSILNINNNPALDQCSIDPICEILRSGTGADLDLYNNGKDCREDLVRQQCGLTQALCPETNISLNGQSEVDKFHEDYPECESMEYSIYITSLRDDELIDLSPLNKIIKAQNLRIYQSKKLSSLVGLENLKELSALILEDNDKIETLHGLENIDKLKVLVLNNNSSLKDIGSLPFEKIKVMEDLSINSNDLLNDLAAIAKLDSIKQTFFISDTHADIDLDQLNGIHYIGRMALTSVTKLEEIKKFSDNITFGELNIASCVGLKEIYFSDKMKIEDGFILIGSSNITSCIINTAHDSLNNFEIKSNNSLQELQINGPFKTVNKIYIQSNNSLTNFSIPSSLEKVEYFNLSYNNKINSITNGAGLKNINNLSVISNPLLENLSGFDHAINISLLEISQNPKLANCAIEALCHLSDPKQAIIHSNGGSCSSIILALGHCSNNNKNPVGDVSISGLESLNQFKKNYPLADSILGNLIFKDVTDIQINDLEYFRQIQYVDSTLIFNNCVFNNLEAFKDVSFTDLEINNCQNLESLPLFNNLKVGGNIKFVACQALKSIKGLGKLQRATHLYLKDLDNLTDLKGLEQVSKLVDLTIHNIPMYDLKPLQNLEIVSNNFIIYLCQNLSQLKDLKRLRQTGSIHLYKNPGLQSLFEPYLLDNLQEDVSIRYCDSLDTITGFEKLKGIQSNIEISYNKSLKEIRFDSLEMAHNVNLNHNLNLEKLHFPLAKRFDLLSITDNQTLKNIGDWQSLEFVSNTISIYSNELLSGLNLINPSLLTASLELYDNPNLSICHVPFICNQIYNGKKILLWNNGQSCQIEAEVEELCGYEPKLCPSSDVWIFNNEASALYNTYYSNCSVVNGNLSIQNTIDQKPIIENIETVLKNVLL